MSAGSGGGGIGRREVAVRCFAGEYDDASLEYSESDEERAPNYVVTPTGARVNRLFVAGVLTEVEAVSDDVLRARVVDPTGAFVVYAGQYQPDAKTFLERAEPPQFVAVTGKARTFEPDDGDRVYTSVRPESINAVDADTRDRWTVQTAEFTVERVAAFAAAVAREERGPALTEALADAGVDPALAAGIPRAIDHYGTTEAYLAAVREMALQAAEVVAGRRDEVEPLDLAPDAGGRVEADLTAGVAVGEVAATTAASAESATDADAAESTAAEAATGADVETGANEDAGAAEAGTGSAEAPSAEPAEPASEEEPAAEGGTAAAEGGAGGPGDFDDFGTEAAGSEEASSGAADASGEAAAGTDEPSSPEAGTAAEAAGAESADVATDELYEMDEEERRAVEDEFGTEFSTGNEVDEPGQADVETPGPVEADEGAAETDERGEPAATEPAAGPDETAAETTDEEPAETEPDEPEAADDAVDETGETVEPGEPAAEVDLQDAVVEAMGALDEGDGADREAVVEDVAAEYGADREAVEDAIQDALMGGRCYEPSDGRLKAI